MAGRPHHNLFYYYRGPSSKSATTKDEERYQQQVEDNSTKALVNVLELGGSEVTRSFLTHFAPSLGERWPRGVEPQLFLQSGPEPLPPGERLLLGISLLAQIDPPVALQGDGSRIDAAIHIPGAGMLAIEVKVVDDLDGHQLARHRERWQIAGDPLVTRWVDVWRWARAERARHGDIPRFLLDQLCAYLEILGFAQWAGFREEDFAFFIQPTLEQRTIVRSRMAGAWERVLDELPNVEATRLGKVHSGRLPLSGKTPAWAQTNHGQPGANLTLELRQHELQLNLVAWRQDQMQQLLAWAASPEGERALNELRGFEIVLYERRATRAQSGKPWWQRETHHEYARISGRSVSSSELIARANGWQEHADTTWRKLAAHIRRTYPRAEVLAAGEAIVERVVADVTRLLPILSGVNRWK